MRASTATARLLSAAASDNATAATGDRPAILVAIHGHNAKAAAVYLKLYNKASAPASTDTPRKTIYLPASASFNFSFPAGIEFPLGLGYRLTLAAADNDATALLAGDILALNLDYA